MTGNEYNIRTPHHAVAFESAAAVTIDATTDTVIETLTLNGLGSAIGVELENTGANSLDAFFVEAQAYPGGAWFTYISSSEMNAGNPLSNRLLYLSTSPTTLAAAGKSEFGIIVLGLFAVRFKANAAAGGSTAKVRGVIKYGSSGGGGGGGAATGFQSFAGNPAAPVNSNAWYDSTDGSFKFQTPQGIIKPAGVLYCNSDTDTALTNPTVATDFGTQSQFTFPANTLAVGQVFRITASGKADSGGAISFTPKIVLGSASVYNTSVTTAAGSNDWFLNILMRITAIGSGTTAAVCLGALQLAISANATRGNTFTFATQDSTGTLLLKAQGIYGTTNASNVATCEHFLLERVR